MLIIVSFPFFYFLEKPLKFFVKFFQSLVNCAILIVIRVNGKDWKNLSEIKENII